MDIEIKKSLIAAILQTENEEILEAIKNLLKIEDKLDFWDQLSLEDQEAINEGIRQLDEGKSVLFDEVKDLIKERFNFRIEQKDQIFPSCHRGANCYPRIYCSKIWKLESK